jgi:phage protein D
MFNHLDVKFPTLSVPLTRGYSLTSHHARYEHETHTIRFIDWNVDYTSISDGTPIVITLKGYGSGRVINGYVHHITPDLSPNKNYVDITVIGASRVFKQQSQKIWKNATADQVISEIAKSQGFSFVAFSHPRFYEQISQAGMSDWELMVKLAKQNGYSLKCDNTTLHFQPLTQEFTDSREEAAYFVMHGLDQKATGIYSFTPIIGESVPFSDARKATVSVAGIDKTSKDSHSYVNQKKATSTRKDYVTPIFDSYHTRVVAPSYQIAKYESEAADERNRYPYRGEVVIQGNPTVLPDSPVFLDGIGTSYSGYWTVLSVEHHVIGNKEYTTKMVVGTDSLGLSTTWTDNKNIAHPSQSVKRVITPGIRQKNLVPKTSLTKIGTSHKESLKTPFSMAKNITTLKRPSAPSYKWSGTGTNLKTPPVQEKPIPPIAKNKIRSKNGR